MSLPTPKDIEADARAKGLSIPAMCRRADLPSSTFHRWKAGKGITLASLQKMIDAIEAYQTPTQPQEQHDHG